MSQRSAGFLRLASVKLGILASVLSFFKWNEGTAADRTSGCSPAESVCPVIFCNGREAVPADHVTELYIASDRDASLLSHDRPA